MNRLERMTFLVLFDRDVDKDLHYISPGQYGVICNDGELTFDFREFVAAIDEMNPRLVCFEVSQLDIRNFEDACLINPRVMAASDWSEFYILTGEDSDPELNPLSVSSIYTYFENGDIIQMDDIDLEELYMEVR